MKPSLQSLLLASILKAINMKKRVEKSAGKAIARSGKDFIPRRIIRSYTLHAQTIHGKSSATFESKEKVSGHHLIFFHGGAYIFEASPAHWWFAEKIVKKSFCRMTLLDYPLAPEHNYLDTFRMISKAYEMLNEQYPEDKLILMGDSAGGGLALAFAQKLIQEKHPKLPEGIVLLSPWLDLTMSNPGIKDLESKDHLTTVNMLRTAGSKYADGADQDQYLLSPINGKLDDLPQTIVFYGSEELFHADCTRLKYLMETGKQKHVFREYERMQHDWALFPIPEAGQVVDQICDFLIEL